MRQDLFLSNTKIPLIIHQTWKGLDSRTWSDLVRQSVNRWLEVAVGGTGLEAPPTAYIMWDDTGVEEFMKVYENSSWSAIEMMPYKVERADVFRVAVLKWFGGVVSIDEIDSLLIPLTYDSMQTSIRSPSSIPHNGSRKRISALGQTPRLEPNIPFTNPVSKAARRPKTRRSNP
jgi:mannosyltransferase OCH1-like enzyme